MDAQQVLETARSGNVPSSWFVWTLRRDRVLRGVLSWSAAAAVFLLLLLGAAVNTIPGNFERGATSVFVTSLLLLLLAGVAFGSAAIAIYDTWRVTRSKEYLLVITPEDYVKAEPRKVTHVPMSEVQYITLKGVKTRHEEAAQMPDPRTQRFTTLAGQGTFSPMWTGASLRREPAQAPSLAFQDARTGKTVVVATDDSFEALPALAEALRSYARDDQRMRAG